MAAKQSQANLLHFQAKRGHKATKQRENLEEISSKTGHKATKQREKFGRVAKQNRSQSNQAKRKLWKECQAKLVTKQPSKEKTLEGSPSKTGHTATKQSEFASKILLELCFRNLYRILARHS